MQSNLANGVLSLRGCSLLALTAAPPVNSAVLTIASMQPLSITINSGVSRLRRLGT